MLNGQHGRLCGILLRPQVALAACDRGENGGENKHSPMSSQGYAFPSANKSTGEQARYRPLSCALLRMFESESFAVHSTTPAGGPHLRERSAAFFTLTEGQVGVAVIPEDVRGVGDESRGARTERRTCTERCFYRPTPMYWKPMARRRDESSRFLVSMMIGRFTRWRILVKSSVLNSGQPVATTSASTPSATP